MLGSSILKHKHANWNAWISVTVITLRPQGSKLPRHGFYSCEDAIAICLDTFSVEGPTVAHHS